MSTDSSKASDSLLECDAKSNPIDQFSAWFQEAIDHSPGAWFLPEAMTLATASEEGIVSARIVLLKQADEAGFVFYTNYDSLKGEQMLVNKQASLVFYWPYLTRQVRIEGQVARVSREDSEEYFHSRPKGSQVGAIVSDQSRVIESREWLEQRYIEAEQQYTEAEVPLPDYWGGYCLVPKRVEFWQGRDNRLHDRLRYISENGQWAIERLAP